MADTVVQSHLNKSRLDKFVLVVNLPSILKEAKRADVGSGNDLQESMQLTVYGAIVPSVSIPAVSMPFGGQVGKVTSFNRPAYDDVSISFNIDNRFKNYDVIWKWLNALTGAKEGIYDPNELLPPSERGIIKNPGITSQDIDYKKEYATDMSLYGLDEYNKRVVQFTYTDAFPVRLGDIDFSYQNPEEISCKFTFTFNQLLFKRLSIN